MKMGKLALQVCAFIAAAALSASAMQEISFAEDAPKAVLIGQIGENEIWDGNTPGAENPEITGDATYSAYLPLKYSNSVKYLALNISGLSSTVYENLAVTVDKIRIDGKDYSFDGTPAVNTEYVNGDFSGTRVYIVDGWEGNPSVIPKKTTFSESVEVIFSVSGTGRKGPDFVDKRAAEDSTEASTEPETQNTTVTEPVTEVETEPATGGVLPGDTSETSVTSETTAATTTSVKLTTVTLPSITRSSGYSITNSNSRTTGTAPLTSEKGVAAAFAGLVITAGAAVMTKIKRK